MAAAGTGSILRPVKTLAVSAGETSRFRTVTD
jgi:hypothetical protein